MCEQAPRDEEEEDEEEEVPVRWRQVVRVEAQGEPPARGDDEYDVRMCTLEVELQVAQVTIAV